MKLWMECKACYELVYEPITTPCGCVVCKRCFRLPKSLLEPATNQHHLAVRCVGAYPCPNKLCNQTHLFKENSIHTLLSNSLQALFPTQYQSLSLVSLAESNLKLITDSENTHQDLDIPTALSQLLVKYLDPAIELSPHLQLPYIVRSKVLAQLGRFADAKLDSQKAHDLNHLNKRGIVSEKLVLCLEQVQSSNPDSSKLFQTNIADIPKEPTLESEYLNNTVTLPIFQSAILFPNSSTSLHFSEPRDRVMIKRAIETNGQFGVMLPPTHNSNIQCGTVVRITRFDPLLSCDIVATVDGNLPRYVCQVKGITRFRIQQTETTDAGYINARVTLFEDQDPDTPPFQPQQLEQLVYQCRSFVIKLLDSMPPTARLHFERQHGKMPNDCTELSFWLGEFLPLNPYVLYQLIPIVKVEDRLRLLCEWLEKASTR
ncbi:hypothetical protein HDV02_004079 [Globomyces sp. JEL0801]|nr:hypothetical protein HDV02_004079 [Globomyces sp. JEL0801]